MTKARIGFIGVGIMGSPMIRRLLGQGWAVNVWNREPERYVTVVPAGAVVQENPAAVCSASDIVILCVLDAAAVEDVCFGPGGVVQGHGANLLIDMSTVNPQQTIDLAARLQTEAGMAWLDAPISGGPDAAEAGKLTIMAGGSDEAFARARDVLGDIGGNATHAGPLGAGQTAKIINQAIVGVEYVLMAEVLTLCRRTSINPDALPSCLAGGLADGIILQKVFPRMAQEDFYPSTGYARQLNKDLKNLIGFVEARNLQLPLIEQAVSIYAEYASNEPMNDSTAISNFYSRRQPPK